MIKNINKENMKIKTKIFNYKNKKRLMENYYTSSDVIIKECEKGYINDQDKVINPKVTIENALKIVQSIEPEFKPVLKEKESVIENAYSFHSVSNSLISSGKGLTKDQSMASAIMEFVERYSWFNFEYSLYDGYKIANYDSIIKMNVETVDKQYFVNNFASEFQTDKLIDKISQIPQKWILGKSVTKKCQYYVPLNWNNYMVTSNGLAAGNKIEEAILQGLCELIERENVYRLLIDCQKGNLIRQSSLKNELILKTIENAEKIGISFNIIDITFDLSVPTFIVVGTSEKDKGSILYQGVGQGAHPNPLKAIIRALSEYFESYSSLMHLRNNPKFQWNKIKEKIKKNHYGFNVLRNEQQLFEYQKIIDITDIKNISQNAIHDELNLIIEHLEKKNYEVVVVNKTHPKLNIPVVRVFVPGLRSSIAADPYDPDYVLSELYYEAGMLEKSNELFIQSEYYKCLKNKGKKANDIFKDDYRETLKSYQKKK